VFVCDRIFAKSRFKPKAASRIADMPKRYVREVRVFSRGGAMSEDDVSGADPHVVVLGEVVDITTVRPLWQQLSDVVQTKRSVVLQGGAVAQVDTAGMQLLSAFVQEANGKSIAVSWQDVSDTLRNVARLLNLSGHLQLPDEVPTGN